MKTNAKGPKKNGAVASRLRRWEQKRKLVRIADSAEKWLLLAVVLAALFPLFPSERRAVGSLLQEGAISKKTVIAPFAFKVLKDEEELRKEREAAERAVPPVLVLDPGVGAAALSKLENLEAWADTAAGEEDSSLAAPGDIPLGLGVEEASFLLFGGEAARGLLEDLRTFLERLFDGGIMSEKVARVMVGWQVASVITPQAEMRVPAEKLVDISRIEMLARERAERLYADDPRAQSAYVRIAATLAEPNVSYDEDEVAKRKKEARSQVSEFLGMVLKDEKIIGSHERVTKNHILKLSSLEYYRSRRAAEEHSFKRLYPYLGRYLLILLVMSCFFGYLSLRKAHLVREKAFVRVLAVMSLAGVGLTWIGIDLLGFSYLLIPLAMLALVLTVMYDGELGLVFTLSVATVVAVAVGLQLNYMITTSVASAAAVYSVLRLRRRRHFYRSVLFISLSYAATVIAFNLLKLSPPLEILKECGWGVINAAVSTGAALVSIPVLGAVFGVTNDMTLLELSDLNTPLLRRMMLEAAGTYHHSMIVGNLAEAAAEAIGANSLLARVGSYYHDIGKIAKPEYYRENEFSGTRNRHERLSPTMSCLILESHVRDGVELAREHHLPRAVIDAIKEHHGTTTMSFFYQKAKGVYEDVDEADYKYPGPKPRSRETAIIMLADCVEAASRSLENPTPSRIKSLVKRMIELREREGQLDECKLTTRDLSLIAEAFVPVLIGIFHRRIEYPSEVKPPATHESHGRKPAAKGTTEG